MAKSELDHHQTDVIQAPAPPTSLPPGWACARLGDLGEWRSGGTPSKSRSDFWTGGTIPWVSPKDMKRERLNGTIDTITPEAAEDANLKFIEPGGVLFVVRGMILARAFPVALADKRLVINQDMRALIPAAGVDAEYLLRYLQAQEHRVLHVIKEATHGTLRLDSDILKAWPVLVPPLAEQRRIASRIQAVLSRVTAARERLAKVPTILKRFRQSVLAAACSGRLTAHWRVEHGAPERDGAELPPTWQTATVADVIESLKYGTSRKCDYNVNGVPVLRIPNIGDGVIDRADLKYAALDDREFEQLRLREGDVLMIRSNGSVSLLGKAALVRRDDVDSAYAGYLIRLRPDRNKILPEYLNMVLGSFEVRLQIELPARSTSGVNNINSDEVRALPVKLPPLDEQREIVRQMSEMYTLFRKIEVRVTAGTLRSDKLVQATLAKALRGELVHTEAELAESEGREFETAEQLLERVRANCGSATGAKPRRSVAKYRGNGQVRSSTEDLFSAPQAPPQRRPRRRGNR